MIEKLREILRTCEFVSDDVDMDRLIAETIVYIKDLENKYKQLSDLNAILRHNLKVAERKQKK